MRKQRLGMPLAIFVLRRLNADFRVIKFPDFSDVLYLLSRRTPLRSRPSRPCSGLLRRMERSLRSISSLGLMP